MEKNVLIMVMMLCAVAFALAQQPTTPATPAAASAAAKPATAAANPVTTPAASGVGLYNCAGVQDIGKTASNNICCQVCACLGQLEKSFSGAGLQKYCKQECGKCVVAGNDKKTCPTPTSALPTVCSKGLQFNAKVTGLVNQCVNMYTKDRTILSRFPGC